MNGTAPTGLFLRLALVACLVVGCWLAVPSPVHAARRVQPAAAVIVAPALLADGDGWGWKKVMGATHNRTRVIQLAVVCMCFGLFILMRR